MLLFLQTVAAQPQSRPGFDVLSVGDGLSQAAVHAIVQDRYGFMWFGTQEGLNRFDGSRFTHYIEDSRDPESIGDDWIWDLVEDTDGNLWVGTNGGGLNRFRYADATFEKFLHDPNDPTSISSDEVRVILQDSDGRFWVGTESHGLNLFDPKTGRFMHFRHQANRADSLSSDSIRSIVETHDGMIWIGTDGGGLNRVESESMRVTRYPVEVQDGIGVDQRIMSLLAPGDGSLWVGTYESGLLHFDPVDNRSVRYTTDVNDPTTLSSGTDITDLKALESQLRQSQKMDALGAIASGVAHDFNNVLASVLGYSELARTLSKPSSKIAQYLGMSIRSIDHGRELVSRILSFSRKEETKLEPVHLQVMLSEAIALLRPAVPANINLTTAIDLDCNPVLADASELHQVVMNLGTNACHAMGSCAGNLAFGLESFGNTNSQTHVRLSISDTGEGIHPNIIEQIFDPFFTTKEKGKGTGLGLAMAHSAVTKLGGKIRVESELGVGATFEIDLPCCEHKDQSKRSEQRKEPIPVGTLSTRKPVHTSQGRGEHVLLVEDDHTLQLLTETILSAGGYSVASFSGGHAALEYFRRNQHAIDLVLTDNVMPGLCGTELAELVWEQDVDIPIVLASGKQQAMEDQRFDAMLVKPVEALTLISTVRQVLDTRKQSTLSEA